MFDTGGWDCSGLALCKKLFDDVLILKVQVVYIRDPLLNISILWLEILQLDPALVPGLVSTLGHQTSSYLTKNLKFMKVIKVLSDSVCSSDYLNTAVHLTFLFLFATMSATCWSSSSISKNRIISGSVQFGFRFRLSWTVVPVACCCCCCWTAAAAAAAFWWAERRLRARLAGSPAWPEAWPPLAKRAAAAAAAWADDETAGLRDRLDEPLFIFTTHEPIWVKGTFLRNTVAKLTHLQYSLTVSYCQSELNSMSSKSFCFIRPEMTAFNE